MNSMTNHPAGAAAPSGDGSPQSLLALAAVRKTFGATVALKGVDLEVRAGSFHALLGENGAGKSTLVKLLAGIHRPTSGTIRWEGEEVEASSPSAVRALGIGIAHQDSSILPELTVGENFALGREPVSGPGMIDRRRVREALAARGERFDMDLAPELRAGDLSTGDRKILEIMKILDDGQRLLVLDEPTASLTAEESRQLMDILRELKRSGVAILYVTHRLEEIEGIVDRVTVLRDGANVGTLERDEASENRVISLMVGRELGDMYPPAPGGLAQDVLLAGRGLSRTGAFADVGFEVRRGEIVAFVGLAGHGSFDVARSAAGLAPASAGSFEMAGEPVRLRKLADALRAGMGFLGEDRADNILHVRSVRENLSLAALRLWSRFGFVDARRERKRTDELITALSVRAESADAKAGSLSGGNQQKLALGRWLAADTRLLILLDPTAGVDVGARAEIYRLLRAFADDGRGVLVATSDLAEALGLADRIYAFYRGAVAAEFGRHDRDDGTVLAAITGQRLQGGE